MTGDVASGGSQANCGGASAQKRRLVVKPLKQPEENQEADFQISDAESSDSDESHTRQRIKLKVKRSRASQHQQENDSAAQSSPAELSQAQKVTKGVLKLKCAAPFSRPVNEEEVPGYGAAVQQPMDLLTVLTKLKDGQYLSLGKTF